MDLTEVGVVCMGHSRGFISIGSVENVQSHRDVAVHKSFQPLSSVSTGE